MKKAKGPAFTKFFRPILQSLRKSGGTGTASEIVDLSIEAAGISEAEQEAVNKNGQSKVKNQVHWARQYLAWGGFIDSSKRGIWSLTEQGRSVDLETLNDFALFKSVHKSVAGTRKKQGAQPTDEESEPDSGEVADHRTELLDLIKQLPPEGFERLCQRLLRESGFQQVTVTGKSGDGGIDGVGALKVNPFVSFNVLFKCKRYDGTVTPSKVRDFRGAMMGRADKGIIITTGTFTLEAKKEARRDGVPPIELVDGEALVEMFEELELGLKPRKSFDLDRRFFDEFQERASDNTTR